MRSDNVLGPLFQLLWYVRHCKKRDFDQSAFSVQVVGRKTVWLAPPEVGEHMQAYTRDDSQVAMTNTSRVDVFGSDGQHRQFESHVVPKAFSGTLESGDALFFPPGWWHGMRSEEPSFSVSMWF